MIVEKKKKRGAKTLRRDQIIDTQDGNKIVSGNGNVLGRTF